PIDEMLKEGSDVVRATILVVEIIGMLPHVDREERYLPVRDRRIRIGRLGYAELVAFQDEPRPTAAELSHRGCGELFGEGIEAAEPVVYALRDLATRQAAPAWRHRFPVEGVVPRLCRIVEQSSFSLARR